MFGKIYGRFFLNQYLGISGDNELNTVTLSELIETYPFWENFVINTRNEFKCIKLFIIYILILYIYTVFNNIITI